MLHQSPCACAARRRSPSSTASVWTARAIRGTLSGGAISQAGADPRRRRRLPVDARAASSPAAAERGAGRRGARGRRESGQARRGGGRGRSRRSGHRSPAAASGRPGLTAREVDVLRLLARGLSSKQIATRARDHDRRRLATTSSTSTRRSMRPPRGREPLRHRSTACSERWGNRPRRPRPRSRNLAAVSLRKSMSSRQHTTRSPAGARRPDCATCGTACSPRHAGRCSRSAPAPARTWRTTTASVESLMFTEPEPAMLRRLQAKAREQAPLAKVLRAPAEDLPVRGRELRHRRLDAGALRRRRPGAVAARDPPSPPARRPAALHRARALGRPRARALPGPDELAEPLRRRAATATGRRSPRSRLRASRSPGSSTPTLPKAPKFVRPLIVGSAVAA